jgi:hypothetical protein
MYAAQTRGLFKQTDWGAAVALQVPTYDDTVIQAYPEYCKPNVWPCEHLPELRSAFRDLGGFVFLKSDSVS